MSRSHLLSICLSLTFLLCAAGLLSCAGHQPPIPAGLRSTAGDFTLNAWPETFLGAKPAGSFELRTAEEPGGVVAVAVYAKSVQQLKAFYGELCFDPTRYCYVDSQLEQELGPAEDLLSLVKLAAPGRLHFGEVIVQPAAKPGLSGDGMLAQLRFKPAASALTVASGAAADSRGVSRTVQSTSSSALCTINADGKTLSWFYANRGDYDQNGLVILSDLTPIAAHFREQGPFNLISSSSQIDGDGNGEINLADITPISDSYGSDATGGFDVFTSLSASDYPDGHTQLTKVARSGHRDLSSGLGSPGSVRMLFSYTFDAAIPNSYFWVRPRDAEGNNGTPSTLSSTVAASQPVLSALDIPEGTGTESSPFIVNPKQSYNLHVELPGVGDVTASPSTHYYVIGGEPGTTISASGHVSMDSGAISNFTVVATTQDGVLSSNRIIIYVGPATNWSEAIVDAGSPSSNEVGAYCSAGSVGGRPAIAYYDATSANLKYAQQHAAWEIQTIDADGDVGRDCHLLGTAEAAMISYRDTSEQALKFAYAASGDPAPGDWHSIFVTTGANDTGSRNALGVFAAKPAIAYSDNTLHGLCYARATVAVPQSQADWSTHLIDACGDSCDLSIASVGALPAIAYRDTNTGGLKYARALVAEPSSSGDWVLMTIDDNPEVGFNPALTAFGAAADRPIVSYYDAHWDALSISYAPALPSAGVDWGWDLVGFDAPLNLGNYSSIHASADRFWIAYSDQTNQRIRFAVSNSIDPDHCDWNWGFACMPGNGGAYSSLSWLPSEERTPWIAFLDSSSGNLKTAVGLSEL